MAKQIEIYDPKEKYYGGTLNSNGSFSVEDDYGNIMSGTISSTGQISLQDASGNSYSGKVYGRHINIEDQTAKNGLAT